MGIDIYLKWAGQTEEDEKKQFCGCATDAGDIGYLREAYHGGPYATKLLVREAFEAGTCQAEIPAAVMRERLKHVTEPARNCDGGHNTAMMIANLLGLKASKFGGNVVPGMIGSGHTTPMTVEEAIRERCSRLYPEDGEDYIQVVLKSFRDFVELAERKERETGKPCTIYASY
jgi:hypothetical protein